MNINGSSYYSNSNLENASYAQEDINSFTQILTGITYNATSDTTTITNNVSITGTLSIPSFSDVNTTLSTLSTALTDISYSSNVTTIDNVLAITGHSNIATELDDINNKLTGITYDGSYDVTSIDNSIVVGSSKNMFSNGGGHFFTSVDTNSYSVLQTDNAGTFNQITSSASGDPVFLFRMEKQSTATTKDIVFNHTNIDCGTIPITNCPTISTIQSDVTTLQTNMTGITYSSDTTLVDNTLQLTLSKDIRISGSLYTTATNGLHTSGVSIDTSGNYKTYLNSYAYGMPEYHIILLGTSATKTIKISNTALDLNNININNCNSLSITGYSDVKTSLDSINTSISSINTTLTDISYSSDTTTINNNVVISSGKTLTVNNTLSVNGVLSITGYSDVKTTLDGLTATSAVPVGTILSGVYTVAPTGYLLMNGQMVLKASYPALFAVVEALYWDYIVSPPSSSYFYLPDLAGTTLRGYGTSDYNANYVGPTIAAFQNDGIKRHGHKYAKATGLVTVANGSSMSVRDNTNVADFTDTEIYDSADADITFNEQRVHSFGVCFIIKY